MITTGSQNFGAWSVWRIEERCDSKMCPCRELQTLHHRRPTTQPSCIQSPLHIRAWRTAWTGNDALSTSGEESLAISSWSCLCEWDDCDCVSRASWLVRWYFKICYNWIQSKNVDLFVDCACDKNGLELINRIAACVDHREYAVTKMTPQQTCVVWSRPLFIGGTFNIFRAISALFVTEGKDCFDVRSFLAFDTKRTATLTLYVQFIGIY